MPDEEYSVKIYNDQQEEISEGTFTYIHEAERYIIDGMEEDAEFYPDSKFTYKLFKISYNPVETELPFEVETVRKLTLK